MATTRLCLGALVCLVSARGLGAAPVLTHPPQRPLPTASQRAMDDTPARFVDPLHGDNANTGTREAPWRTLAHAISRLLPGQTLYLRGGTYWESVTATPKGTADAPITIRAYPGELAILDGGLREFFDDPANAWEPCPDRGTDEYRSKKAYPIGLVGGNCGDSMVPLRMYGSFADFRASSEYQAGAGEAGAGVYVGPGVRQDEATGRIHLRLAHTTLEGPGAANYRGQTDPRKVPMVITGSDHALQLSDARHVRVQDIVMRGALTTARITDSAAVEFDGVTIYAVQYGMVISGTTGLKVVNSAFRGFNAPWHPRASGTDVDCFCPLDLVTAESGGDMEFAYNEFTDHHDCFQIGEVTSLTFHHNLVDRFNDDGIDLAFHRLGTHHIYQNRISHCLTAISIHEGSSARENESNGVYFYRNVFDLRRGIYGKPPSTPDVAKEQASFDRPGRLIGDHGSPVWPPLFFYHNTILNTHPPYRGNYGGGMATGLKQTSRRVFNNIFVHERLFAGLKARTSFVLPPRPLEVDLHADGNLHWGVADGAAFSDDFFGRFRQSAAFEESRKAYPPGWTANDVFADPRFTPTTVPGGATMLTLQASSPAVNAGVPLPRTWPDPLRDRDEGAPDIGAIPLGVPPWTVGVGAELGMCASSDPADEQQARR